MSFTALKQSLSGGRSRSSTADLTFEIVEAERADERSASKLTTRASYSTDPSATADAVTLPLNFQSKTAGVASPPERCALFRLVFEPAAASLTPLISRARLASFSRRVQGVLDARKSGDPFQISPPSPFSSPEPQRETPSKPASPVSPLRPSAYCAAPR